MPGAGVWVTQMRRPIMSTRLEATVPQSVTPGLQVWEGALMLPERPALVSVNDTMAEKRLLSMLAGGHVATLHVRGNEHVLATMHGGLATVHVRAISQVSGMLQGRISRQLASGRHIRPLNQPTMQPPMVRTPQSTPEVTI